MTYIMDNKGEVYKKEKRVGLITKGKSVRDGREDYVINEKEKKVSKIKAFTDTFH